MRKVIYFCDRCKKEKELYFGSDAYTNEENFNDLNENLQYKDLPITYGGRIEKKKGLYTRYGFVDLCKDCQKELDELVNIFMNKKEEE